MLQPIRKLTVPAIAALSLVVSGVTFGLIAYDRPAAYIVMHHQGGPAWTKPDQARVWFKSQGYEDVAYNAMITPDGHVWPGRDERYMSAANLGINAKAVAFCLLGDLDKKPPTDAQLTTAGLWVRAALKRHPGAKLIQHLDASRIARNPAVSTECPGRESVRTHAARTVFLVASGYRLAEAKRRAIAGK